MKRILLISLFLVCSIITFGRHLKGGWIAYKYLGAGSSPNTSKYEVTVRQYLDITSSGGQIDSDVALGVFDASNNSLVTNITIPLTSTDFEDKQDFGCISPPPEVSYRIDIYVTTIEVANNNAGYVLAVQRCCRINGIINVDNSGNVGLTYTNTIPGVIGGVPYRDNNSAVFAQKDTAVVCHNNYFVFDFSATDADGDVLRYSFTPGLDGADANDPKPGSPANPPYANIPYTPGFSGFSPLGPGVTIDPNTGIISGIAPGAVGDYVVAVVANEYRNGVLIASTRKELHINVANCTADRPVLDPVYATCDGFTRTYSNNSPTSSGTTYLWNFGDPSTGTSDTSTSPTPTHTYSDTGVFVLRLKLTTLGGCTDSTKAVAKVYPGFIPGFITSGHCVNSPVQFTDKTTTKYGLVDSWSWDFGDPATIADTSHNQNPAYTYTAANTYPIKFTVTNSKGCIKTIQGTVVINPTPRMSVPLKDTTYCGKDSIQLSASADLPSTFSWTPATFIQNPNTANPTVFPTIATTYFVTANAAGCTSRDSVKTKPLFDLSAVATASPSAICEEDTITLTGTSNHSPSLFLWSPASSVQNASIASTRAYPKTTTTYTVTAQWGKHCFASNNTSIAVKPLARPDAGPDAEFCTGTNGVQLNATGGDYYTWAPVTGLSNSSISNPRAVPTSSTTYYVSAGVNGCSKLRTDSVFVLVRPRPLLRKTNDTLICSIDTLQLNAFGSGTFVWSPNYNLINPTSAAPQVFPKFPFTYYVTLTDQFTCQKTDSVFVNVKQFVTIDAGNDTTMCKTDTIHLNPVSDALHYKWTPTNLVDNDTAKYARISPPTGTTTFHVIGNIGKCQSNDDVRITVVPYPTAKASNDTAVCFGIPVHLNAAGGSIYTWSPTTFLSDPNIPNPVASPDRPIKYVVYVRDILGCPKAVTDTVFIQVRPQVIADAGPADTSVIVNQPLLLTATGGQYYLWTPPTGLSDPTSATPVAQVTEDITYNVVVSIDGACSSEDSIRVHVYKVVPGLFVPNAFTPGNGDGLNDVFRPVAIGIAKLSYFTVYNRWGQVMFSTTQINKGWDGTFQGKPQPPGVYVWVADAVDYNGIRITKKGSVLLIR